MQIGTEFQCEIEKTVFGGDGLTRCDGEVVFLPRTLPGERLIGRITAKKKNYSRGTVVRFGETSPRRIEPAAVIQNRIDPPAAFIPAPGAAQFIDGKISDQETLFRTNGFPGDGKIFEICERTDFR